MRKIEGSRSISSTIASRRASRKLSVRGSRIDVLLDGFGRGQWRFLGEADGVLHLRLRLVVETLQLLVGRDAERVDALREDGDRIALHPLLHLFLGAVLGRVGDRVAAEAVRLGLGEEREGLVAGAVDRMARRIPDL